MRLPKSVRIWFEQFKKEGMPKKKAMMEAIQRAYEEGDISESQADRLERTAGSIKGPGVPDGTGPMRDSDECPYNDDEEDTEEMTAMDREKLASELVKLAETLVVDYENAADKWWNSGGFELWEEIAGNRDEVRVPKSKARRFLEQAKRIPGWLKGPSYAPTPILVQASKTSSTVRLAKSLVAQPGTTKSKAIKQAKKMARRLREECYVVYEDGYHATDERDLDTFFAGLDPIAVVEPDGTVRMYR